MQPKKASGGTTCCEETHGKSRDSELCLLLNRLEGVQTLPSTRVDPQSPKSQARNQELHNSAGLPPCSPSPDSWDGAVILSLNYAVGMRGSPGTLGSLDNPPCTCRGRTQTENKPSAGAARPSSCFDLSQVITMCSKA